MAFPGGKTPSDTHRNMLFKNTTHHKPGCWPGCGGGKGSQRPAETFKAPTPSREKKRHFVALCLNPARITAVPGQVGDERKDAVKEASGQSPFWDVPCNSCCLLTTHWRSEKEVISADFSDFSLQKWQSTIEAAEASKCRHHGGSLCTGEGLDVRGLPLTGTKPTAEASFLRWKRYNKQSGDLAPRLFSEPWVQPREILFPGQSGTHNTLKGSLYFRLNYSDKYQQQEKCAALAPCHMKAAKREIWSAFGHIAVTEADQGPGCFPGHLELISPRGLRFQIRRWHARLQYYFSISTQK